MQQYVTILHAICILLCLPSVYPYPMIKLSLTEFDSKQISVKRRDFYGFRLTLAKKIINFKWVP